ncbi:ABC transporter permease [Paenarthrobacter aurescens]|uniref:ABC transporter permease n=1 Tax=Paenarthrobacter aurescens TaxID=43663 RepID=UPI0021C16151|nr:ABC transporter permease [Paenarthrobacter aurescens]
MRALWTMVGNDFRQRLRDKSVLIFSLIVPLALMGVLSLAFGRLGTGSVDLQPATVVVSVEDSGPLGAALLDSLGSTEAMKVTVREVSPDAVSSETRTSGAALGLVIPAGFSSALATGRPSTLQLIEGSGSVLETSVLISIVTGIVERFTAASVTETAAGLGGISPDMAAGIGRIAVSGEPILQVREGVAATGQLSLRAGLVAGQTGLFLLFTVGFGVLGLLAEKEQGTLGRIRSTAVPQWTVVAAKAVVGFSLGVAASAVLLASGTLLFGVDFGSPAVVVLLVLAAAAAATSLTFIVAKVVRSAEQANVAQSIIAMVLGIAGGAFFPIQASGFMAVLMDLNPVGAFIRGLGISAGGGGVAEVAVPLMTMWGFAAACILTARFLPDRGAKA